MIQVALYSFILGFALTRASTCTVAATKRLVLQGRPDWLTGIAVAVCWSAVSLLVMTDGFGLAIPSHLSVPINATLIAAAVSMGFGAYLNGACFIGSVGRICGGELSFLLTFAGLAAARKLTERPVINEAFAQHGLSSTLKSDPAAFWILVALFTTGFLYGIIRVFQRRQQAMLALCVMGIAAALLFSSNPDWSYEAWVGRVVNGQGLSRSYEIELIILALFSGAVISSIANGKFRLTAPGLKQSTLCFLGGLFMGFGAKYAPGGNDTLLLWTIPSFALYGFVTYAIMVATVALCVHLNQKGKGSIDGRRV